MSCVGVVDRTRVLKGRKKKQERTDIYAYTYNIMGSPRGRQASDFQPSCGVAPVGGPLIYHIPPTYRRHRAPRHIIIVFVHQSIRNESRARYEIYRVVGRSFQNILKVSG